MALGAVAGVAWLALTPARAQAPPRQIAPDIVAPPQLGPDELQREPPRGPLSEIGPAGPSKPKKPKAGPNLFNPLAVAAGVIEARGLTVTIAGIDVIGVDETCSTGGTDWACGVRARTAFRSFLRGRAIMCDLPAGQDTGAVSTACTVGAQDVGDWLVANGWARASASGPYMRSGESAESGGKGIFGPAPDLAGLLPEPAPFEATSADQSILTPGVGDPEPAAMPPAGLREPF